MNEINIRQLDFHYLLIEHYKMLGLDEKELTCLLLIDHVEEESPSLITGEQLSLKMQLDEKEIDKMLVSLIERNFLSYEDFNGILVTSMKPCKKKIVDLVKSLWMMSPIDDIININENDGCDIYKLFEEKLKRPLTPLELDGIKSWFSDGVKKDVIVDAINECLTKSKTLSVKNVDKAILRMMTEKDRKKEGYSLVDQKNKKDLEESIKIASFDWVNK